MSDCAVAGASTHGAVSRRPQAGASPEGARTRRAAGFRVESVFHRVDFRQQHRRARDNTLQHDVARGNVKAQPRRRRPARAGGTYAAHRGSGRKAAPTATAFPASMARNKWDWTAAALRALELAQGSVHHLRDEPPFLHLALVEELAAGREEIGRVAPAEKEVSAVFSNADALNRSFMQSDAERQKSADACCSRRTGRRPSTRTRSPAPTSLAVAPPVIRGRRRSG